MIHEVDVITMSLETFIHLTEYLSHLIHIALYITNNNSDVIKQSNSAIYATFVTTTSDQ